MENTTSDIKTKENEQKLKTIFPKKSLIPSNTIPNQNKKQSNYAKHRKYTETIENRPKLFPRTITTRKFSNLNNNLNASSSFSISSTALNKKNGKNLKQKPKIYISDIKNSSRKYENNHSQEKRYKNYEPKTTTENKSFLLTDTTQQSQNNYNNKPKVNLNEMLERFKINQTKKNEKIEQMKKLQEENELKNCSHRPSITKNSENILNKDKTDFFTRQIKLEERKKQKEEKLREVLKQNEIDKINNTNYIYQKKLKESSSKGGLNNSMFSDMSVIRTKKEIDENINKLLEWGERRNSKLLQKMNEKNDIETAEHIPTINKRSSSMANRKYKKEKFYERLSKEDELVKSKKKILAEILTPTFKPKLYLSKNYGKGIKEEFDKEEKDIYEHINTEGNSKYNLNDKINENDKSGKMMNKIVVNRNSNLKKIRDYELQKMIRGVVLKNLEKKSSSVGKRKTTMEI